MSRFTRLMQRSATQAWLAATVVLFLFGTMVAADQRDTEPSRAQSSAEQLLKSAGTTGGLIVHVGCGDGRLTAALRANDACLVQGLDSDTANVNRARQYIRSRGLYGPVSVIHHENDHLPYADRLVNLLVVEPSSSISEQECLRVLAPLGVAMIRRDDGWEKIQKPWPEGIDQWTHHLHDADGNPVADDRVVGPPRHLQWTAGPLWARSHGWTPSVTAMVSAGGRLFSICDETLRGVGDAVPSKWNLVARDAFSGVLLWKRPVPNWGSAAMSGTPDSGGEVSVGRFTMPPDAGKRLVAVGDTVFVTLGATAPVSALDAATGKTRCVFEGTENADEIVVSDGRLLVTINPPPQLRPAVVDKEDTPPPAPGKHVCAVDVASGNILWKAGPYSGIRASRGQDPFGRLELIAGDGNVLLLTSDSIECLAADTGKRRWHIERPALPPSAVRRLGYSGMYEFQLAVLVYHKGIVLLAQPEPNTHHTYHTMPGTLYAFDVRDGRQLWKRAYGGWGHCTPPDVFAVGDTVWTHVNAKTEFGSVWGNGYRALDTSTVDYRIQALDLRTGRQLREIPTRDIFNVGHHHRCYRNKSTVRYLMASRRGVELVDLDTGENFVNHWVRSGCLLGDLPCNGLIYVAPHPCGCYIQAKLNGFNALASTASSGNVPDTSASVDPGERLLKGPAFESHAKSATGTAASRDDWPTYRHDVRRSGATDQKVADSLQTAWEVEVGGALSAPVIAGGRVFVADVDAHRLHALDAETGKPVWDFTADGRIPSPPTFDRGRVIFGASDGCVYCLRARDGALVWRFQGAPERRFLTAFDQLESAWPVPGVLVKDGICWFAAGRSSYIDGGIYVYALDTVTGKVLQHRTIYSADPESGKMPPNPSPNMIPGLLNDIPVSDGRYVFIRQEDVSSADGGHSAEHLYTTAGFLDSSWFNRTFWKIGMAQTTGPMVLGDDIAYGIEPFVARNRDILFQPGHGGYQLLALPTKRTALPPEVRRGQGKKNRAANVARALWSRSLDVRGTALVRAAGKLLIAGSPDIVDPKDPHGAWEGRKGGRLAILNASDGTPISQIALTSPPVWDGMAVAGGRIYLATMAGQLVCLAP